MLYAVCVLAGIYGGLLLAALLQANNHGRRR